MKRFFTFFFLLQFCVSAYSQEQIEKIFDPSEQDWEGRNLGQISFSTISAVQNGSQIYFTAYSKESQIDIWKTDLNQTEKFKDLDATSRPLLRSSIGDWLIYTEGKEESICKFMAINTTTKQNISILSGEACQDNRFSYYSLIGDYLAVINHNTILYQDLTKLPEIDTHSVKINDNGLTLIHHIGDSKILYKDRSNVFGHAPYYILDVENDTVISLDNILNKSFNSISPFIENNGKYYFQITTESYVERLLVSIDTNFSPESVQFHGNFFGNLLFIQDEKFYLSDYDNSAAYLGIYDLNSFEKLDQIKAYEGWGYSIWSGAEKINEHQYLLHSGNQTIYHFDLEKNELKNLAIENNDEDFAYPFYLLDSGIFIRYRSNIPTESMYFIPYETLEPKKILEDKIYNLHDNKVLLPLPNHQLFALMYDPLYSSEYAYIDILNEELHLLADINTENYGKLSMVENSILLPSHDLFVTVSTESYKEVFILDQLTKESRKIKDKQGKPVLFSNNNYYYNYFLNIYELYQGFSEFAHHGVYATDDSTIYFVGKTSDQPESQLLAYNFWTHQIVQQTSGIHAVDKIFKVGNEIYIIRRSDSEGNLTNREILHITENSFVSIYKADILDHCYDHNDIHQYFIHNDILYFTSHGKLLSLNSTNNQIEVLVDHLIKKSSGCYTDGVVFGNFFVKDNEVYFTESLSPMFYFYISFLGFIGDIEQFFWKTDGTAAGTKMLANQSPASHVDGLYRSTYLFVDNGDIFRSTSKSEIYGESSYAQLFKWINNEWKLMEVMVDDTLKTVIPPMVRNLKTSIYSQPGDFQRLPARWDNKNFFVYTTPLINDTLYNAKIFSFQNEEIPIIKTHKEIPYEIVNRSNSSKQSFPYTVIGDKIYFPSSNKYGSEYIYHPEILQYSMENDRTREVITQPTKYQSFDNYIVKDDEYETGYFIISDEEDAYLTKIFRLNACPLIDEPINITPLDTSTCQNGFFTIRLEGLQEMSWLKITVDDEWTLFDWEKTAEPEIFKIKLNVPAGQHLIAFYLDSGCELDTLTSFEILIIDIGMNDFSILDEIQSHQTIQYSCSVEDFDQYLWTVEGGNILSGQGSPSILVDWGFSPHGYVSLKTIVDSCESDQKTIEFTTTSVNQNSWIPFKIYPNPTQNHLNIELPKNWSSAEYRLISLDGKIVQKIQINHSTSIIDISTIAAGTYIVHIKNGVNESVQKLVIIP